MPSCLAQVAEAVCGVDRIHLQRGGIHEEARADEFVVHVVVAQHVATSWHRKHSMHLRNSCGAVDIGLCHAPGPSAASGLRGLNFLIVFLTR